MENPVFSNMAQISHDSECFILQFAFRQGKNQKLVAPTIVISPSHAKQLYDALGMQIEKYQNNHGHISGSKIMLPGRLN